MITLLKNKKTMTKNKDKPDVFEDAEAFKQESSGVLEDQKEIHNRASSIKKTVKQGRPEKDNKDK